MSARRVVVFAGMLSAFGIVARAESQTPPQEANRLAPLGWLSGCWEMRRGPRVTTEMWMPPAGSLTMGAGRTVVNGVVRETEQFTLSWTGDSLVFHALPSGQAAADFKAAALTDSGFTVENLKHDFPQRIIYRRRGTDSLLARIEGPGQGGTRGIDYPLKRVSCTAP